MLDRHAVGDLPRKHHTALKGPGGALRHEECLTRAGFDGPYSILYHEHRPHELEPVGAPRARSGGVHAPENPAPMPLRRRHYRTERLEAGGAPRDAGVMLLSNVDLSVLSVKATRSDSSYLVDGDSDDLYFVHDGEGLVRSVFGDLPFSAGDYVCVPKGVLHRVILGTPSATMLLLEFTGGLGIPKQWRNEAGQLRMDAPYCHRDFRRPVFEGPRDEGIRDVVIRRNGVHHDFRARHSPLDVVGWDGTVYPWALPILAFQPRVSSVHLPPTWHGTFAAKGALVCSFVPRPLDFHPEAVPCPYPHASVDVDEVIYYVSGDFSSRSGVRAGSVTLHPRGVPHGPHPGRYEASPGASRTSEVAVMLDVYEPLRPTPMAGEIEDPDYERSFLPPERD